MLSPSFSPSPLPLSPFPSLALSPLYSSLFSILIADNNGRLEDLNFASKLLPIYLLDIMLLIIDTRKHRLKHRGKQKCLHLHLNARRTDTACDEMAEM